MQNVTLGGPAESTVTNRIADAQKTTHPGRTGPESDVLRRDRAIAAIAARQLGLVTAQDLAAAGLRRGALARRVAAGRLHPVYRGVYALSPALPPLARELAAVLSCGSTAVLSHHAAAVLWAIRPARDGDIDVTVARQLRARPGVRVHRARALYRRDVTRRHGIPVTTAARTLLDLAAVLDLRSLARAVEEAELQRLVSRRGLTALIDRSRGRRGAGALRAVLASAAEPAFTRSEAEAKLLALIRAARLPTPEANARIGGYEVDFLWRAQRLVVEVDGFAYHSTRAAFERDRRKDADLRALGLRTTRITYRQIAHEAEAMIASIASSLSMQEVHA
jgi:very-short-patch-repair endonuclease